MPNYVGGLAKLVRYADELLQAGRISTKGRTELLAYLKGEDPALRDMAIGQTELNPAAHIPTPKPTDTWYRGGPSNLRLEDPTFLTSDPQGAAYYAIDRSKKGLGAVGEYNLNVQNPARFRDILNIGLQDQGAIPKDATNILDWSYSPQIRQTAKDMGHDSFIGSDVLSNSEIPAISVLDKNLVIPRARSLVTYNGHPAIDRFGFNPENYYKDDEYYTQIGPTKPFTHKKKGGLVGT